MQPQNQESPPPPAPAPRQARTFTSDFRRFFFRGLGILLPTILTLWILVAVYGFVDQKIAQPINSGVKRLVLRLTPWPGVSAAEIEEFRQGLTPEQRRQYNAASDQQQWLSSRTRAAALEEHWQSVSVGGWAVLDLIGLGLAIILIYMAGILLGSYLGHHAFKRGEEMLRRIPVFRQVYPYVKQVTDFLVGESEQKIQFNKVVAVQYPRKGLWSVGLVTGATMRQIQENAGSECITVFVPSSPTPFTGYVITVPIADTIELPISIDEALRFTVSGGVIVPGSQEIGDAGSGDGSPDASEGSARRSRGSPTRGEAKRIGASEPDGPTITGI